MKCLIMRSFSRQSSTTWSCSLVYDLNLSCLIHAHMKISNLWNSIYLSLSWFCFLFLLLGIVCLYLFLERKTTTTIACNRKRSAKENRILLFCHTTADPILFSYSLDSSSRQLRHSRSNAAAECECIINMGAYTAFTWIACIQNTKCTHRWKGHTATTARSRRRCIWWMQWNEI